MASILLPSTLPNTKRARAMIVRDMRTQYVISYDPTNKTHDGTYRSIKIVVDQPAGRDKRIALTRSGRTASTPGATATRPTTPATNRPSTNVPRRPPQ